MAATSQIEIETTLPCLNHLPLPGWYPYIFYRPFLLEDLQAYNTFSNKPLIRCGQGNPQFELSNTQDRFQRVLESSFTQGIHLAFFFKRENQNEFELIAEGGVYMAKSTWPSLYWTRLDIEINELKTWKLLIRSCIEQFWWSIPRKIAHALYSVQKQEKAMRSLGWDNPQPDLDSTREFLTSQLSPSYLYFPITLGIFLKEDAEENPEGEMIGYLGVGLSGFNVWPWVSYILKEEYWGKKYGTEFLQTFMIYWSSLPRKQVQHLIDPSDIGFQLVDEATERISALVGLKNLGSRGILQNNGFKEIPIGTDDPDSHWVFMMDF
ncbi:GNAT domain-containing protein [Xylaria castorea]|nr:GNAT domain-containing protein [Xylaria castorea]